MKVVLVIEDHNKNPVEMTEAERQQVLKDIVDRAVGTIGWVPRERAKARTKA
ncbi:MAG: hypothetical protein V8S96_03445 [Lachnospiraceae bacterium]